MRLRVLVATLLVAAALAPASTANPLRLVSVTHLDARLEQLAFSTPAVTGTTRVRILLPGRIRRTSPASVPGPVPAPRRDR